MRWNLIEADASITLHVLSAVDLQVSVGVDRDQHGANVGLGVGGGGSEVSPRGPGAAPPSSLQPCICGPSAPSASKLGPHVDQVLPEAPPQVLDEGGLAGEVLQQHEVLYPHPVTGGQRALHGDPHPVTAQGLQGWATGESQRRRGKGRPLLPFATAWTTEGATRACEHREHLGNGCTRLGREGLDGRKLAHGTLRTWVPEERPSGAHGT